jgi:hypothetical protein
MVDHRRFKHFQPLLTHIQKSRTAWSSQEFTARRRQKITPQLLNINAHLTRCLTGIKQIRDTVFPSNFANFRRWVDQAAIGRNPRYRDKANIIIQCRLKSFYIQRPRLVRRNDFDGQIIPFGTLKEGNIIRRVLCLTGQDARLWCQRQRVECVTPCNGRIFHERNFAAFGVDMSRNGVIDTIKRLSRLGLRLITANLRLKKRMVHDGINHTFWHQG